MILGGTQGDRVFIRLVPEGPSAPNAPHVPPGSAAGNPVTAGRYLVTPPAPGYGRVAFMPVSPARTAGANPGSCLGHPAPRPATWWPRFKRSAGRPTRPSVAELTSRSLAGSRRSANGYGEASPISVGRVAVDRAGPNAAVDAPFLSATLAVQCPDPGHDRARCPGPARRRVVRRCGRDCAFLSPRPTGAVAPGPGHRGRRRPRQPLEPDPERHRRRGLSSAAVAGPGDDRDPARCGDHDLARSGCFSAGARPRPRWPVPIGSDRAGSSTEPRPVRPAEPGRPRPPRRPRSKTRHRPDHIRATDRSGLIRSRARRGREPSRWRSPAEPGPSRSALGGGGGWATESAGPFGPGFEAGEGTGRGHRRLVPAEPPPTRVHARRNRLAPATPCPMALRAYAETSPESVRSIAARAADDPGPVASGEHRRGLGGPLRGSALAPAAAEPGPRGHELAPPDRYPAQADVERPQQQGDDEQQRPQVGEPVGRAQVVGPDSSGAAIWRPPVAARSDPRNASLVPSRRYSAEVGATRPTVRPSGSAPGLVWVSRIA